MFVLTEEFAMADDVPYDVMHSPFAPPYCLFSTVNVDDAKEIAQLSANERHEVIELREVLERPVRLLRRIAVFRPLER